MRLPEGVPAGITPDLEGRPLAAVAGHLRTCYVAPWPDSSPRGAHWCSATCRQMAYRQRHLDCFRCRRGSGSPDGSFVNTGFPAVSCGDSATRAGDSPKDGWPSAAPPASRSFATDTADRSFRLRGPSNRQSQADHRARHVESPSRREAHGGFGTAARGNGSVATPALTLTLGSLNASVSPASDWWPGRWTGLRLGSSGLAGTHTNGARTGPPTRVPARYGPVPGGTE